MSINVAVVDDQDIIRLGVQQSLSEMPHITFVGGFSTLEAFCRSACRGADVVLLDDSLPDTEMLPAIHTVQEHWPEAAVLLLGSRLTASGIHRAIQAGASGVVCKNEPVQDMLVMGIRHAHAGKIYLSPGAALIAGRIGLVPVLSRKLDQVLRMMARGYLVTDMVREMGISRKAVYERRKRLREILEVETNEQIVAEAIRRGLLSDEV